MRQLLFSDVLIERGFPREALRISPDSRSVQLHGDFKSTYLRSCLKNFRKDKSIWINLNDVLASYEFQLVENYKYIRYRNIDLIFSIFNHFRLHPSTGIELFEIFDPQISLREYMEFDFSLRFRASIPEAFGLAHLTFMKNGSEFRKYTIFPTVFCNVDLIRCFPL